MTCGDQILPLLDLFREVCAAEADKEAASAAHRGDRVGAKVAEWTAKHIRQIDVGEWLEKQPDPFQ